MSTRAAPAFASYAVVGAAATVLHYLMLILLVEAHLMSAWQASGAGAVLGAQVAFFGNRKLTFAHRGPVGLAWLRFMGTAAFGAALGMALVALGVGLGWHYLLAQAMATMVTLLATFAVNRAWTFAHGH